MVIDREKCINWLKTNKQYYCCESPTWVFDNNQEGNIRAVCEYCGHEVYIPCAALSSE